MADDVSTPPPTLTPEAAKAAIDADRAARVEAAEKAIEAVLQAHRCHLAVWVECRIGADGITRHAPGFRVEALP